MQIKKLILQNIKSHENTTIDFSQGINAIIGENGSGKSTILESIGSVLFQSLDYNKEQFIRNGCKKGAVILEFRIGKGTYTITKTFGSNAEYYIEKGNERIVDGSAEIVMWLKQRLGIDQKTDITRLFQDVIGVQQGCHTSHFLLPPASRKKIFDPILNIESYEECWKRLRKIINIGENNINDIEMKVSNLSGKTEDLDELEEKYKDLLKEVTSLEESLNKDQLKLFNLTKEKETLENMKIEYDRIPRLKDQISIVVDKIKDLNMKLETINNNRNKVPELKDKVERYDSIENTLLKFSSVLTKWSVKDTRGSLENKIHDLEFDNTRYDKELEVYTEIADIASEYDEILHIWEKSSEKHLELDGQIDLLMNYNEYVDKNMCPILNKECSESGLKESFGELLYSVREDADDSQKVLNRAKSKYDECSRAMGELKNLNNIRKLREDNLIEIKNYKEELSKLDEEYKKVQDIQQKSKPLENELKSLSDCKTELGIITRGIKEENIFKDKLVENKDKFKELQKELDDIKENTKSFDSDTLEFILQAFNEQLVLCSKKEETLSNRKETMNMIDSDIDDRNNIIREIDELMKDQDKNNKILFLITSTRDTIKKIPEYLVEQYLYHINNDANVIYTDITNNSEELNWTNNYEVKLGNKSFNQLSGGEQMIVSLSIRLALLRNLTDIDISFFDEPTVNLDEPHRSNLAEMISRIQGFNQLFVISHDDSFDSIIENTIHINKENDISEVI